MAITHTESSVVWASAYSVSVSAGGSQTSDVLALDATCVNAQITLKADNSAGAAASDDVIYFYLLQSSGDPDGNAVSDEYDTSGHATFLAALDTSSEDPAIKTVPLPLPQKGLKVYAEGSTAGSTNAITVSAVVLEQRAA